MKSNQLFFRRWMILLSSKCLINWIIRIRLKCLITEYWIAVEIYILLNSFFYFVCTSRLLLWNECKNFVITTSFIQTLIFCFLQCINLNRKRCRYFIFTYWNNKWQCCKSGMQIVMYIICLVWRGEIVIENQRKLTTELIHCTQTLFSASFRKCVE